MADIFSSHSLDLAAPATGAFAITPSDTTIFDQPTRAVYVGAAGTLAVEMLSGGSVFFEGLPAGAILPVRVRRVLAASTASFLVGLY
ncbi:hypothetical protein [Devosia sp. Leaf64]|uniref:spike base protein, RCAP_Rcc01079 family n=1 Tax=Devosia sp. Leaf64 TaxID=1736229 RepID=UPI000713DF84|nr:hypothetical protein [Devosia sp. Leaf64]KQN74982.1 hypothetical protein ASE94_01270 [Devosia sp. Leaf64]